VVRSNRYDLWDDLRQLLELEGGNGEAPEIVETILPVIQLDPNLWEKHVVSASLDLTGSAGGYVEALTGDRNNAGELYIYQLFNINLGATSAASNIMLDWGGTPVILGVGGLGAKNLNVGDWGERGLIGQGDGVGAQATGNGGDASRAIVITSWRRRVG